jgi:predicted SAM-dependent methyltransferase
VETLAEETAIQPVKVLEPSLAVRQSEPVAGMRMKLASVLRRAAARITPPPQSSAPKHWASAGVPLKLHVGCDVIRLEGFVNIDARRTSATDLVHPCKDLSPFDANVAELVFSNAFFEHLFAADRLPFLQEAHRVLVSNGMLYLTGIPDFEGLARAYLARAKGHVSRRFDVDEVYRYTHGNPEQAPTWWLEQLHKSINDGETLASLIAAAGFNRWFVFRYAWGDEANPVNLGALAQKVGSRGSSRTEFDDVIAAFMPVTRINPQSLEVLMTTL